MCYLNLRMENNMVTSGKNIEILIFFGIIILGFIVCLSLFILSLVKQYKYNNDILPDLEKLTNNSEKVDIINVEEKSLFDLDDDYSYKPESDKHAEELLKSTRKAQGDSKKQDKGTKLFRRNAN